MYAIYAYTYIDPQNHPWPFLGNPSWQRGRVLCIELPHVATTRPIDPVGRSRSELIDPL